MFVQSYLGRVSSRECDQLGHMNVQFYVARVSDAAWHLMASIGITPTFIRERQQVPAVVKQEISYLREALAGDLLNMESAVVDVSERKLSFFHRLRNVETGQLVMTCTVHAVNMDLGARRSAPLDSAIIAAARERLLPADALQ